MGEENLLSFGALRKAAAERFEKQRERLDNAINNFKNGKCQKRREPSPGPEQKNTYLSFTEDKFLLLVLGTSAVIVCTKILYANQDFFRRLYHGIRRILSSPFKLSEVEFVPKLQSTFSPIWDLFVNLGWLFVPALIGIATTYITWRLVYLDSQIPGVQPATPFSSHAKNMKSYLMGANGYTFALWIGIIVFIVLLFTTVFA